MVRVARGRAFRTEAKDDSRLQAAQKADDGADQFRRLELMERPVSIAGEFNGFDSENTRRRARLLFAQLRQFLARRHEDAGSASGVPIRCTEQITADSRGGVL